MKGPCAPFKPGHVSYDCNNVESLFLPSMNMDYPKLKP